MIDRSPNRPAPGHDESHSHLSPDANAMELLPCPTHQKFRIEAFCPKEDHQPALLCIKCLLDPEISKEVRGSTLITIRDLIVKSIEKTSRSQHNSSVVTPVKETLEQKFLEFTTKDYIGIFERHVESQMKKLDREIDRIQDSLQNLRAQFVTFFSKQSETLRNQEEELRKKVVEYIEEKDEIEKLHFTSVDDLLSELRMLEGSDDYERFIRTLYRKSVDTREDVEGSLLKKIGDMMVEQRSQVSTMKNMRIDTFVLEGKPPPLFCTENTLEMRTKLDAIDILDKSTALPGAPASGSRLEKVLEKLHNTDKKSTRRSHGTITPTANATKSKDVSSKVSPHRTEYDSGRRPSLTDILKDKFGVVTERTSLSALRRNKEKTEEKQHSKRQHQAQASPKHQPSSLQQSQSFQPQFSSQETSKFPNTKNASPRTSRIDANVGSQSANQLKKGTPTAESDKATPYDPTLSYLMGTKSPYSEQLSKLTQPGHMDVERDQGLAESKHMEDGELPSMFFRDRQFTFNDKTPIKTGASSVAKSFSYSDAEARRPHP